MLIRVFGLIFLISMLTITMLTATVMSARVLTYQRAVAYVPAAYQTGLVSFVQAFATGSFVDPGTAPPACISNDAPCTFYASVRVAAAPGQAMSAACTAATNCAANLQVQPVVAEGRLSAQIIIRILDANKNEVVSRVRFFTARTFGVAPYVAVVGERDGAMTDRTAASEGDNGGTAASRITVKYHDSTGTIPDTERNEWSSKAWTNSNTQ